MSLAESFWTLDRFDCTDDTEVKPRLLTSDQLFPDSRGQVLANRHTAGMASVFLSSGKQTTIPVVEPEKSGPSEVREYSEWKRLPKSRTTRFTVTPASGVVPIWRAQSRISVVMAINDATASSYALRQILTH